MPGGPIVVQRIICPLNSFAYLEQAFFGSVLLQEFFIALRGSLSAALMCSLIAEIRVTHTDVKENKIAIESLF